MNEHTPGPWGLGSIGKHTRGIVASPGPRGIGCSMGMNDAEALANARLMAAAPDLLFELEGLVHFADGFGVYGEGPAAQELRKWIGGARAAIAKATGSAS